MDFLVGADPELFVKKKQAWQSAHNMVPGTKAEPYPVERGAVQVDGMALEFNIDPAKNEEEFLLNINTVLKQLKDMIPDDVKMVNKPHAYFNMQVIKDSPEEALILGCEPDYNAWKGGLQNPAPKPARKNFRTASGHVHVGWCENEDVLDPEHLDACIRVAQQLDCLIGTASVLRDPDGKKRRELYGKAGAFRPKSYGMEYRVLSNFWVGDDELTKWLFKNVQKAMNDLIKGKEYHKILMKKGWDADDVEFCINEYDHWLAEDILHDLGVDYLGWRKKNIWW